MKTNILLLSSIVLLTNCGQKPESNGTPTQNSTPANKATTGSNYAILKFNSADNWMFAKGEPTDLSIDEISIIEAVLKKCVDSMNVVAEKKYTELKKQDPSTIKETIDIQNYKRQFVSVITDKGKIVWVNCFCDASWATNWDTEILQVFDGGNCFFNLKIDLTTKRYFDVIVNGQA